ncbi:MAG TPA: hypothetical protein VHX86_13650 [Tepidisphaeraceae bacterium]|jgi:hypothetical protein|nr:hypothetical protein [Tepidisphaeraceae bacterium]
MNQDALDKYKAILNDNPDLAIHRGRQTEADTRANVLDRLIHDVLEWPRRPDVVTREPFANPGFIDYQFFHGRPLLLLEAKRAGITFSFPYRKQPRRILRIETGLLTDAKLSDAVNQVQGYCNNTGCRFAVATNGYSFIFFRAITEGSAWKSGVARVFYDPGDIETNFTEFWNLLSYEAVTDGKLDEAFRHGISASRGYYKPLDDRVDSDATYGRNALNVYLRPYVEKFFGDIAVQDTIKILKECYVYSRPIQIIDYELQIAIEDQIPRFANSTRPTHHSPTDPGGDVGRAITAAVVGRSTRGSTILVMGGIGSGKSTFCRRFFRVVAPGLIAPGGKAMLVYLDFLGAPDDPQQLEILMWKKVSYALRTVEESLKTRAVLEQVFKTDIDITREVYGAESSDTAARISDLIIGLYQDDARFGESALRYCAMNLRMPIVVFDNVDQLKINAQVQLFTAAQRLANMFGCVSILVLREESYSSALLKKHLTATNIRPYHLSSPSFRDLLTSRVRLALEDALSQAASVSATDEQREHGAVASLFVLLQHSVLGKNRNIIRLVDSIAYGNMRLALNLFNSFITSGATNISKILKTFTERGDYIVPFYEFAKSVTLGDFHYYRESRSLIANLFEVSRRPNASHFTALRILNYLANAPVSQNGGREYVALQDLLTDHAELFGNEEDCKQTILRLISEDRQLLDLDTRRTDTLEAASEIRATSAGMYYLHFLSNAFAYCDLVWHDTPFEDRAVCDRIGKMIRETDMLVRFERVEFFLSYLQTEEKREFADRALDYDQEGLWGPFMPRITRHIAHEKEIIRARLHLG